MELSLSEFTDWLNELQEQPRWRMNADKEADYADGNQLDSEVMQRAAELGLPPAIEPLIGPTIDSVLGLEAKTRKDWRVMPDENDADEVAEAMTFKLSQAERKSKADMSCAEAFADQVKVGLGWVEVSRCDDPFKYPYRCNSIHRNEIWWDWLSKENDLSDARYLIRRKWTDIDQAALRFPEHAELIKSVGGGWSDYDLANLDGGRATGLYNAWDSERGWSIEEQEWRDTQRRRVCLYEVWYRRWERVMVIKTPDGRIVELDQKNDMHLFAIASGIEPVWAVIARMHVSYWMGPHKLHDGKSPYKHNKFPYVPFWGKREDRTKVPFGLVRGMIYLQDEVNARIAKMQWGLGSVRTTRTDGAVLDDDDDFREQVARVDADIVLDADHMARPGAMFKVERDFELNQQQYQRLADARDGIRRVAGIQKAFLGEETPYQTGAAVAKLTEQSAQTIAKIYDNFQDARKRVGELLLSLVIEDMIGHEENITIEGDIFNEPKQVALNKPTYDPMTGIEYLDNDIERIKLKVELADVPETPTFRAQQVQALSEVIKSAPPEFMSVLVPRMIALMDVPDKKSVVDELRQIGERQDPMIAIKEREVAVKESLADANVKKIINDAVQSAVTAMFSATQAGMQIASMPQIAPVADQILKSAGMQDADQPPIIDSPGVTMPAMDVERNTSPAFPPRPGNPAVGINEGIEA